jgi:L-fuconolactonase
MSIPGQVDGVSDRSVSIVDCHHHMWFVREEEVRAFQTQDTLAARALASVYRRYPRYMLDEFLLDLDCEHDIVATVYSNARTMYRLGGPPSMRSVGEVEFANGIAAMAASGLFGKAKVCAGIVGGVDLALGHKVEPVLDAHMQAGGRRYKGVRFGTAYDDDRTILGDQLPGRLLDPTFREGFSLLRPRDLSFDAWILEPQLPDLIDLARAFPDTQIVLDHLGSPVGVGRYAGERLERFALWRDNMRKLSECENVFVKIGGFGNPFWGFEPPQEMSADAPSWFAQEWKPYIETSIEAFSTKRCMFESNYPVDSGLCSYSDLWRAFKCAVSDLSINEQQDLFCRTAIRFYRLEI